MLDRGKLEGALNRPASLYFYDGGDDVVALAIALLMAVAQAHAFARGNKRTAFSAAPVLLALNGYGARAPDEVALADLIIAAVEGQMTGAALADALADHVHPLDP